MHTMLVMPCLNEELLLARSCASLGFGIGSAATPANASLILVDNGSTDATPAVMARITKHCRPGAVVVIAEPERGYVPARHAGIVKARHHAKHLGIPDTEVLILQVDADTVYDIDYVPAMTHVAARSQNAVLEGVSHITRDFVIAHHAYCTLCDRIDDRVAPCFARSELDVIVSDFASGFRLSDYATWGGHRREYDSRGSEIHAETSRLLIRAKVLGARKQIVPEAVGYPSRRKIIADPLRYFVSAGFPRGAAWQQAWDSRAWGITTLQEFEEAIGGPLLADAIALRERHLVGLFGVLPELVRQTLGRSPARAPAGTVALMIDQIGPVPPLVEGGSTAPLFEALFAAIDGAGPKG